MKRFYFSLIIMFILCITFSMAASDVVQQNIISFTSKNIPQFKSFIDSIYNAIIKPWWNLKPIDEWQPFVIIFIGFTIFLLYYQFFAILDDVSLKRVKEKQKRRIRMSTDRYLKVYNDVESLKVISTVPNNNLEKYYRGLNPLRFDEFAIEPGIVTMAQLEDIRISDENRHEEPSLNKLHELLEIFGPTVSLGSLETTEVLEPNIEEAQSNEEIVELVESDPNSSVISEKVEHDAVMGITLPDEEGYQEVSIPITKIRVFSKDDFADQKNIIDLVLPIDEKTEYVVKKVKNKGIDGVITDFYFNYTGVWNPNIDNKELDQQGIDSIIGSFKIDYFDSKLKSGYVILPTKIDSSDKYPPLAEEIYDESSVEATPVMQNPELYLKDLDGAVTEFMYNYMNVIIARPTDKVLNTAYNPDNDTEINAQLKQFLKSYFAKYDPNKNKETELDFLTKKFLDTYLNQNTFPLVDPEELMEAFNTQYLEAKLESGYTVLPSENINLQRYSELPLAYYPKGRVIRESSKVNVSDLDNQVDEFAHTYLGIVPVVKKPIAKEVVTEQPKEVQAETVEQVTDETANLSSLRRRKRMDDSLSFYDNLNNTEKKTREEEFPFVQGVRPRKQYQSLEELLSDEPTRRSRRQSYNFKDKDK